MRAEEKAMKLSLMLLLMAMIVALSHAPMRGTAADQSGAGPQRRMSARTMWVSVCAIVIAVAVCLGIAAYLLEPVAFS
jgi:hypothetical protein